jgi:hypothetical protein
VSFSPFNHVPSDAKPSPPPSTITVTGRAITTYSPAACRETAAAMPAEWARVDATITEHCPDAVSVRWQPCDGWGLGLWCVRVRDRSHEEHLRRTRSIRRALQPLRVAVEVTWVMGQ